MSVFQKFPILIIKEEFPFIWELGNGRKCQKLTKYPWCKKEKNVNDLLTSKKNKLEQ